MSDAVLSVLISRRRAGAAQSIACGPARYYRRRVAAYGASSGTGEVVAITKGRNPEATGESAGSGAATPRKHPVVLVRQQMVAPVEPRTAVVPRREFWIAVPVQGRSASVSGDRRTVEV